MVAFIGFFITRYRHQIASTITNRWLVWRRGYSKVNERIVIVGSGEGCQTARWLLSREKFLYAFSIVGVIDDDIFTKKGMCIDGYKILGSYKDLPKLVNKYDIGLIIFTVSILPAEIIEYIIQLESKTNIRLIYLDKLLKLVDQQLMPKDTLKSNILGSEMNLEFLATHSELTGLPNSYLFRYQLKHSLEYSKRYHNNLSVLIVEIKEYEVIVRTYGLDFGRGVLKEVAKRLTSCKRESDMLACLNDNKFAFLLENTMDCNIVDMIFHRISVTLAEPVRIEGRVFYINPGLHSFIGTKACEESRLVEDLPAVI